MRKELHVQRGMHIYLLQDQRILHQLVNYENE